MYNGIRETITQEDFRKACREVLQVHVRFSNNEETCKAAEAINARYPGAEAFVNENNADIVSRGLGKAEGIAILTKAISFRGQIAAIGDAHNDLGMLRRYQGCTLQAANPAIPPGNPGIPHICRRSCLPDLSVHKLTCHLNRPLCFAEPGDFHASILHNPFAFRISIKYTLLSKR